MRPTMTTALLSLLLVALAPSTASAKKIWVELGARDRAPVAIPSLAPLVEKAARASLVVYTEGQLNAGDLPPGHPMMPPGGGGHIEGQGAGFIIHPTGYALTNAHVIENASEIRVRVGTSALEVAAEVVGVDAKTDVALLRLKSARTDWPALPLADSDALRVGDFVVAIGNPFGLAQTVSMGILSAKGRRDIAPSARVGLYDFLQTDASINPGNSGGPLLNLAGEAVGINTAVNAAAQGIGFAIPINMVKAMLPDLEREGRVVRSWIGIGIQRISPELARGLGLERPMGALVRQVVDEGPGAAAGLQPGDIITHFDGHVIAEANELPLVAGEAGVGKRVRLDVVRDGKKMVVDVTLGSHPDNRPPKTEKPEDTAGDDRPTSIGLRIVTLNRDDRRRLGLGDKIAGARVVGVDAAGAAAEAGLMPDDVILKVNGRDVRDAPAFARVVQKAGSGEVLRLFVRRGDQALFVAILKP